jgi:hypothetical protein
LAGLAGVVGAALVGLAGAVEAVSVGLKPRARDASPAGTRVGVSSTRARGGAGARPGARSDAGAETLTRGRAGAASPSRGPASGRGIGLGDWAAVDGGGS